MSCIPVAQLLITLLAFGSLASAACAQEVPAPEDIPRIPDRLAWFQDLKFGLMLHWGPYSQRGYIESWPLVEEDTWARPKDFRQDLREFRRDYWALNTTFNPTRFDPDRWAEVAQRAGMRYVVFTTKHHDGFNLFDTHLTDYKVTAPDCPYSRAPRPDVVAEVFRAFRARNFGIGAYYSKADWHSPLYWSPDAPAHNRNPNYDTHSHPERWTRFVAFVHGQIRELVTGYGPIDILWLDAGQVRPPDQDLGMDRLVAMARRFQPGLIVADRTVGGAHENYLTPEQQVPERPLEKPWESCLTMGTQWSYKPDDTYKSTRELIHLLIDVVAKGGNLLLNVGPRPDGQLPGPALARLEEIGAWMAVNAEAIHATRPIAPYHAGRVALTRRGDTVYAFYLAADGEDVPPARIRIPAVHPEPGSEIRMLGVREPLRWSRAADDLTIEVPDSVRRAPPCRHAFAFRMIRADR
jgi:alpha-L-fucosidase